jgi:hypothetical protein
MAMTNCQLSQDWLVPSSISFVMTTTLAFGKPIWFEVFHGPGLVVKVDAES